MDTDKAVLAIIDSQFRIWGTKKAFIRILFNAADVNNDGYLDTMECNLLLRHLTVTNSRDTREIFANNGDLTTIDDKNKEEKVFSFERFAELAI